MHEICRNRKVILLTATPFNNYPRDIFSLLKLFIYPKKSTITFDAHLDTQFFLLRKRIRRTHVHQKELQLYESRKRTKSIRKI